MVVFQEKKNSNDFLKINTKSYKLLLTVINYTNICICLNNQYENNDKLTSRILATIAITFIFKEFSTLCQIFNNS